MTVKLLENPTSEAQHQRNVIVWSQIHRAEYPELALLFHIPNGGTRDEIEAKHLQSQGVRRGVPDLCLPVARRGYHSLWLEMKTLCGRVSDAQGWWKDKLTEQGACAVIAYGWKAAVRTLEWYLGGGGDGH